MPRIGSSPRTPQGPAVSSPPAVKAETKKTLKAAFETALKSYPFGEHRCGWRSARRDRGLEHSEGGLPVDVCFEERERAGDFERLAPEGGRELEDALRRP